jgi:tripartite-type tricarboxylate transporter receptor subunit TctC
VKSRFVALTFATLSHIGIASAQGYPSRYITIIVPFTAGSPVDTISRILASGMSRVLGQQLVVENITGAGGTTGITRAAKAAPDGYTMVIASTGTHAGATALYPNLGYDPSDSFESVGFIGSTPVTVVARKDLPPNTLQELIAHLRANQKTVTLAHAGIGSISHIFCTYFQRLVGVRTVGVPFRGLSDSTQALLAGQVDYSCNQAPLTVEYVNAGTLKAYAITSEARSPMMPLLPTAIEAGLPAFTLGAWSAFQFPRGTSDAIVKKVNQALSNALDEQDTRQRFASLGIEIASPERRAPSWLGPFIRSEVARWKPILEEELAAQRQ